MSANLSTHLKSIYIGYDLKKNLGLIKTVKKRKFKFQLDFDLVFDFLNSSCIKTILNPQYGHSSSAENGVSASPSPITPCQQGPQAKCTLVPCLDVHVGILFRTFCPHCVSVMAVKPSNFT